MEDQKQRKKYLLIWGSIVTLLALILGLTPAGRTWLTQAWRTLFSGQSSTGSFSELFPADGVLATRTLTVDGHTYRLKISTDKKQLTPLPGESANFDIQLTEDKQILSELPSTLTEHSKAKSPVLQLEITGVANLYNNGADNPPVSVTRPSSPATHIYSPQATDIYRYLYKSDTLTATLDFSSGSAEFGYVYGGGKTADQIKIQATAVFYDGEIKQGAELPFADEKIIATTNQVPSPQYQKGDIYYQASFAPAKVNPQKEINVKLTIKSVDAKTGQINTNPYQRVRVELWPMRAFYAFKEARFEEAGKFLAASIINIPIEGGGGTSGWHTYDDKTGERLSGTIGSPNTDNPSIIRSIYWYLIEGDNSLTANTSTEVEQKTLTWVEQQIINYQKAYLNKVYDEKQMADYLSSMELLPTHVNYAELDLVDGVGEVYFRYSGNVGAIPYVTFTISPENFFGSAGGKIPYCDSDGEWYSSLLPAGNHRYEDDFCIPKPPTTTAAKVLYGDWLTEAGFKQLQQKIQTITYLPIDR